MAAAAAAAPKAKTAGARHHLTIAEKNQLRACHRAHPDMTQELLRDWAHSKFGKWVGRSTIGKITSSPDETCVNQDAKRNQSGRFPDMERALYGFVLAAADADQGAATGAQGDAGAAVEEDHTVGEQPAATVLNDAVLWAKANEILKSTLGEQHSVSVGWVQRFKKRHGLHKGQKRPLHHYPAGGNGISTAATTPVENAAGVIATDDTRTESPLVVDVLAVNATLSTGNDVSIDSGAAQSLEMGPSSAEVNQTEQQSSGQQEEQQRQQSSAAATTPSDARSTKGPVRKQFLAADDILLLTQALVTKPWTYNEAMDGWREVADVLRSLEGFGLEKSAGACQARVNLLVEHARSGNEGALRKSGSTEEFQQKKQLLAEIVTELDRAGAASSDANSRKRPASELAASTTAPDSSRRRTTPEASTQGASTVISAVASGSLVDNDDVMRRLALLETKLELELAVQRRNAEQQVRELGKQYQQQLERHQRQFDQHLASIEQQQVTIIKLLKIVVERSASQVQSRPE